MNYRKIYKQLCDKGQQRVREEGIFYERHHILPKSFGGRKTKVNLTLLTLKEHYIAHLLLVAIYPESPAMHRALWNMCNVTPKNNAGYERYKPGSRMYNRIRSDYTRMCVPKGGPCSEETKRKTGEANKGNGHLRLGMKHSEGSIKKMSSSHKKTVLSKEARERALIAMEKGRYWKNRNIVCKKTGTQYIGTKEVAKIVDRPYNTVNNWLRGYSPTPEWFHYERI